MEKERNFEVYLFVTNTVIHSNIPRRQKATIQKRMFNSKAKVTRLIEFFINK